MSRLDGKVAVVTGAASGNGRAMALRFAELGADVAIADVDEPGMEETARLVRECGRKALATPCDVARKADIDARRRARRRDLGRLDVCVANAGLWREHRLPAHDRGRVGRTISVTCSGGVFSPPGVRPIECRRRDAASPDAIRQHHGRVGAAGTPAYTASKGGVSPASSGRSLPDCGRHGITSNAIAPGFIDTAMTLMITDNPAMAGYLSTHTGLPASAIRRTRGGRRPFSPATTRLQ